DGKDAKGIVSEVVHDVFGDNKISDYTDDFAKSGAKVVLDRKLYKDSLAKVVISSLIDKILGVEEVEPMDIVRYVFGDVAIGDFAEAVTMNIDTDDNGEWYNTDSEKKLLHIVNDLYSVTANDVLDLVDNAEGKEVKEIVCDALDMVFGDNTVGYYFEDLTNEKVREYLNKEFFVKGTNDIVIANYVRSVVEAEEGKIVDEIRKPFNDVLLGNVIDLVKDVEKDGENWFDGEEKLPLIAAVFMNVSVENVFDYVEAFKGDVKDAVKTVVSGIFGEHKVDDFFEDIKNESVNEFLDKDFFENSINEIVIATFVADILDAEGTEEIVETVSAVFDDIRLGDMVNLTDLVKYDDTWFDPKTNKDVILILKDTLDITVGQIRDYIKNEDKLDAMGIVKKVVADNYTAAVLDYAKVNDAATDYIEGRTLFTRDLGEVTLTDILEGVTGEKPIEYLLKDLFGKVELGDLVNLVKDDITEDSGEWDNGNGDLALILKDLFKVSVEQVYGYVKNEEELEVKDLIVKIVEDIFAERTVNEYVEQFAKDDNILTKNVFVNSIGKTIISKLVKDIVNADGIDDVYEILRDIFNDLRIGDVAELTGTVKYNDGWTNPNGGNLIIRILRDTYDITLSGIVDYVENKDGLDAMGIIKKVVADHYTAAVLDYARVNKAASDFIDKKSIFDSLGEVTLTDILEGVTGDKAAEYIFKDLLGKIMIGDVVDLMKEVEKDGENWFDGEEKLPLIAAVFMNVSVENVFDYVEAFKG
ncbi:MAG: hypothetical protein IJ706_10920, partial [Clostridia bacterium]|nr:hypothetical protein [Clostridia bacterium]